MGTADFKDAEKELTFEYWWPYVGGKSGCRVSGSYLGEKRPKDGGGYRWHLGIDLQSKGGHDGAPILAIAPGTVTFVGWKNPANHKSGLGYYVAIDHDDDPYSTWYGHMAATPIAGISKGAHVVGGQQIGIQGNTGASYGDHLHLQVNKFKSTGKQSLVYSTTTDIGSTGVLDPWYLLTGGTDNSGKHGGLCHAGNTPDTKMYTSGNADNRLVVSDSYVESGAMNASGYNLQMGGSGLLQPSDDERKYGVSVFDTVQALIRGTTAEGVGNSPTAFSALEKYSRYLYYYLNSSVTMANVQTASMPWIRPGFNVWLDPLNIDRIYYVNSVQHIGSSSNGVYTTMGLSFGRSRKQFQKGGHKFGSLRANQSDNVFMNTMSATPADFSKNILSSASDFDALHKKVVQQYTGDRPDLIKAAFDPYYQYLYNTINMECGTVSGKVKSPAIGPEANIVNDVMAITETTVSDSFNGIFQKKDIVTVSGYIYSKKNGLGTRKRVSNEKGAITLVDQTSKDFPYFIADIGWAAASSLTFVSRKTSGTTTEKYYAGAATKEYDSIGEIQTWLNGQYAKAPEVIKNRVARNKKIIAAAEAYIADHYVKEVK